MRTRFNYRCPWVFNNSEPVKNWNQWECNTWWRTHNKLCSSVIISRYQGGNTRRQTKVEVGLGYCSSEDNYLNLHRKWYLKENIVGTTIAKDQFTDTRWYYTSEIVIIIRSFHDRIYIVSMGMNTKVQGRLPLPQCITFHFTSRISKMTLVVARFTCCNTR